ncbi:hypothetical protein Tsubulata_033539 [Turnera subulata]|uniref:Uncharacterized protein n=1 Tax=Turnera subulata TaxID=218843 RepID=A0A9Q0FZA3_9ROSI|nr:hypothetical protein Tsubulata_033539 [Turnera subulata]
MEMPPTHQRNGNSGYPRGSTTALYSPVCATCYSNPRKPTTSIVPYYGNGTGLANSSFGGIGGSWFKSSRRGPAWSSSKSTAAAEAGLEEWLVKVFCSLIVAGNMRALNLTA